jgi:branched-chain amino acid transport system permease protein
MSLELIGNILLDGVAYAMILFMITIGLSMTMGLLRVVNLAHGAFAMAGGFLAARLPAWLGLSVWGGIAVAIVAVTLAAVPIERWLLRRFYGRSDLDQMLVTIGFMFICVALANMVFGSAIVSVPLPSALQGSVEIGPRVVQKHRIFVTLLGLAVLVILWFAVERSSFGIKVRAAVDNAQIAQSVGIDTARVYAIAFSCGAALAALGGIVGAELLPMEASYASKYLVTFLAVIAVGGQGTLFGSFVAALLLGGVETATKYLFPPLSSVAFFLTMFLVLLVRPQGLFGRRA